MEILGTAIRRKVFDKQKLLAILNRPKNINLEGVRGFASKVEAEPGDKIILDFLPDNIIRLVGSYSNKPASRQSVGNETVH